MSRSLDDLEQVQIESAAELRAWLERHHDRDHGSWLVRFKKGRGPYVPWSDVVDQLLCFGWIDGLERKLDDDRAMLLITPRRRGSLWSQINRTKLPRLFDEGLMHPAGIAAVERAKGDGSYHVLAEVDDLRVPDDLAAAFDARPDAFAFWSRFPASSQRAIMEWVVTAKRAETRAKRVATVIERAAENRKANHPRGQDRGPEPDA